MANFNIALLGYGKMNQLIEQLAIQQGHRILLKINSKNTAELNSENIKNIDLAIDFSRPDVVLKNIEFCTKHQLPLVVGTTAWLADLPKVTKWVMENDTALFYASNFSLGVNIFFKINTLLANLLKQNADYQIALTEIHHTAKVDKPSGTAVELANSWTKPTSRFDSWTLAAEKSENQLFIDAQRAENVVGTHIINANSAIDQITISHVAHSRQGFAQGALVAASWLQDKKGIFNMENLLNS